MFTRALLLCCWVATTAAVQAQTLSDPTLSLETWASGLSSPVSIEWLGPGEVLVSERNPDQIRRIVDGVLQTPLAYEHAIPDERVLGIAVNTQSPPWVFVFVEDQTGANGNYVLRFTWNSTSGKLESPTTILQFPPSGMAASQDDGGYILLGPAEDPGLQPPVGDGQLLFVVSGYQEKTGQLRNDPAGTPPDDAGVILRVLQDGSPVPGNPFAPYCSATTTQTCSEDVDCPGGEVCRTRVARYWSYGLRNSFGIAIDPVTGDLWNEENGENEWDELNRVLPGMNSGWTSVMGFHPGSGVTLFEMPGGASVYRDPEYTWQNPTGPTGVAFPHGSSFGPAYDDTLLVADFNTPSRIYAMPLNAGRTAFALSDLIAETASEMDPFEIATDFSGRAVALEFGPDGALYVVSHLNGEILRISGPGRGIPGPAGWALAGLAGWMALFARRVLRFGLVSVGRADLG